VDVGGGRTLRVWTQGKWLWELGNDHAGDGAFYEVTGGGELGARYWLAPSSYRAADVAVYRAEAGRLTAAYASFRSEYGQQEALVIYDAESGETYPRLRSDETDQMPAVKAKWRDRYSRLMRENADLPDWPSLTE
jgi:hypothetical protein